MTQQRNQVTLEFLDEQATKRSYGQAFTLDEMNWPAVSLGYPKDDELMLNEANQLRVVFGRKRRMPNDLNRLPDLQTKGSQLRGSYGVHSEETKPVAICGS